LSNKALVNKTSDNFISSGGESSLCIGKLGLHLRIQIKSSTQSKERWANKILKFL
jgi:hypothetical protein